MQFKLPKPMHGCRAFGGEIAIIVVGVLIALGAEQLVDDLHQRREAQDATTEIRGELALDMAKLSDRQDNRACVEARLADLQTLIDEADRRGGNLATPSWVGRPQFWTMQTVRWEATSQGGRAVLLPAEDLAAYGSMYALMRNLNAAMVAEQGDWAKLRSLEHLRRLTPDMLYDLTNVLRDARYLNWRINVWTTQLQPTSKRLQLGKVKNEIAASRGACVAMNTPREQALKQSNSPYGEP